MRIFITLLIFNLASAFALANPILQADGTGQISVLSSALHTGVYLQDGGIITAQEINRGKMYCEIEVYTVKAGDNLTFDEFAPAFSRDFKDASRNFSIAIISAKSSKGDGIYMKCTKDGAPVIFDTSEISSAVANNLSVSFNFSTHYNANALDLSKSKPFSFLVGKTILVDPDPYVPHPYVKSGILLNWDSNQPPTNPYLLIEKLFYGPPIQYEVGTRLDVQSFYTIFNIPYDPKLGFKTRTYIETSATPTIRRGLGFNFDNNDDYSEYGIEDLKREGGDVLKVLN